MKFVFTTIHVKSLEKSIIFYESLVGLKVSRRFKAGEGLEIAFLSDDDNGSLELIENTESNKAFDFEDSKRLSIGFAVSDIDLAYEEVMKKGFKVQGDIIRTPLATFFFVIDPNGIPVELIHQS